MFTVKLVHKNTMKIIEGEIVTVYPAGKPETEGNGPQACTNKVRQIVAERGNFKQVFYVSNDPSAIDPDVCFEYAYIENSHGATTERVYASEL